jgi:hypothetical protein
MARDREPVDAGRRLLAAPIATRQTQRGARPAGSFATYS